MLKRTLLKICNFRSTLKFNLSQWPGGRLNKSLDSGEYWCQSTSNCRYNTSTNCEGVSSSTHFIVEYPPQNIRISQQVTSLFLRKVERSCFVFQEIRLLEGSKLSDIHCSSDGIPKPSYR